MSVTELLTFQLGYNGVTVSPIIYPITLKEKRLEKQPSIINIKYYDELPILIL